MAIWTPSPTIRVKVLGLAWRDAHLLACEVEDSTGRLKGMRPPGGSIEFGEMREQALAREFQEELGCSVRPSGPWHSFENIYDHEGARGHEFVFAVNVMLGDPALYGRDRIDFLESDGTRCVAAWVSPLALPVGVDLYPNGLLPLIQAGIVSSDALGPGRHPDHVRPE